MYYFEFLCKLSSSRLNKSNSNCILFTSSFHSFISCPSQLYLRRLFKKNRSNYPSPFHLAEGRESSCVRNKKWKKGYALYRCDALLQTCLHLHCCTRDSRAEKEADIGQICSIFPRFSIFTRLWFHLVEFVEIFWSPIYWIDDKNSQRGGYVSNLFSIFKCVFNLIARESIFSSSFPGS